MSKKIVHTYEAPAAIGPYSQGIIAGEYVFAAGQAGLDPATMKLVPGDVAAQADQTMKNLSAVLTAAGTDFDAVVKTTIFLRYMKDFVAVNEVYARYVGELKPARSTVAVSALPLSALVEIEVIAWIPPFIGEEAGEIPANIEREVLIMSKKAKKGDKKKGKGKKGKKKGKKKGEK